MHIMGRVFGAATLVSSVGMALGPAMGGWVFDQFGAYGWLYIGSFVIGLGAGAIGLFLPPLPSRLRSIPQSA
jgi:MFS family permease